MPATTRLGLRYPALTDAPNGPQALQQLAEDTESWVNRAFPCASTTRPASPTQGMMIYETDTGEVRIWTGSAWEQVNGTSGDTGSGGAQTVVADAQYSASGTQTIPSSTSTPVAFGAAQATTPYIERAVRGVGHQFRLTIGGLWAVTTTVRYATNNQPGERYAGIYSTADPTEALVSDGGNNDNVPVTIHLHMTRRFAPDAVIYVQTFSASASRQLERGVNGCWVRVNFALVGR